MSTEKRLRILVFTCSVCSLDRTVLFCFHQCGTRSVCAHTDKCEQEGYLNVCFYAYFDVYLSHVARIHTTNTHHVGCVVASFSLDDHWVSADRSVNRRRRGSRSLRRARSPNSWRHDNNTLRYHCALCAPAAILASRRFWDSSSNVVWNHGLPRKSDACARCRHA